MVEKMPTPEKLCSKCCKNPILKLGKCGACLEEENNKNSNYEEYEDKFDANIPKPHNKNGEIISPPRQTIDPTRARRHIEKLKKINKS